jgi:DNA repair exonuclease SbcCD ATPase subunit
VSSILILLVRLTWPAEEKLAESSAANAALSMQLENIAPQLTSLENSLTDSRRQWKEEQRLRRHAEQAQEMAEARLREVEGSVQQLQRENDALHEELAFKESEIEENKLEMEIEKEQLREELEEIRGDLIAKARQLQNSQQNNNGNASSSAGGPEDDSFPADPAEADSNGYGDDAYAKKLEEELELVTEQLIETEKRLTTTEDKLRASETLVARLEAKQQQFDDVTNHESRREAELMKALQKENADHLEVRHKLTEELELAKEKLKLLENDLKAHEEHENDIIKNADKLRADHREDIHKLRLDLQEAEMECKTAKSEVAVMEKTLQESLQHNTQESFKLKEEIAHLNQALNNSKSDYQSLLDELEAVSSRFDEAVQEAEKSGREAATRSLRQESDAKAQQFKQELQHLSEENDALQSKLDDAEIALGQVKDTQDKNIDSALAQTEMVKRLQQQLLKAKDDVSSKDKELSTMVSSLEERLKSAEELVTKLEHELNSTKSKLAEAESRMILIKREKGMDAAQTANRRKLDEYHGDEEESRDDISRLQSRSFESAEPRRFGRSRRRARSSSPCSVDRMGYRLSDESKKYKDLQEEYDSLKDQKRMGEARIKRLEEDVRVLQQELTGSNKNIAATTQMSRLSSLGAAEHGMDIMSNTELGRDRIDDIIDSHDVGLMTEELRSLHHKCNAQREYNAQLLSKMLSLQGNIQVYCRVRPMTVPEIQRGYKGVVEALSETEVGCFDSRTNKWKSFGFDRVWGPDQSQQSIFQDVEPVALSVVDGYNACIFAYGQT